MVPSLKPSPLRATTANPQQLSLFDAPPPAAWQLSVGYPLAMEWSRRLQKGWSLRWSGGLATLRLPLAWKENGQITPLLEAWCALMKPGGRPRDKKVRLRAIEKEIWNLVAEHAGPRNSAEKWPKLPPLRPRGRHHDLQQIFAEINDRYFESRLRAYITWSPRAGGLSYHTQRLDPQGQLVHFISISRGYDHANCPVWAVGGVVYHECLHIDCPPIEGEGRRIVHGAEFRRREKFYAHYPDWKRWHREILPGNVRRVRRR